MDCFVGASTGALKSVSFKDDAFSNINQISSLNPKQDEITCMSWANADQTELLTVQMDKQLRLFDTTSNTYSTLFSLRNGSGAVRGIHKNSSGAYISAIESGELSVSSSSGEIVKELNAGGSLKVMVPNGEWEGQYATGGKENPLKVWDMEKGEKIFVAKNVRPDELQLRVPIWVNDVRFIPKSQNIVTVTGKHQIRLYDPRAQRRPVKEIGWAEKPLTAMSLCRNEMQIVAGNTRGDMGLFDLRNKMHMVCKYKGFAGSISGIDAHQSAEYIASCSLDRFVRLHELNSKKLVKKIYCKARLNRILLCDKLSIMNIDDDIKSEMKSYEDDWIKIEEGSDDNDDGEDDDNNDGDVDKDKDHSKSSEDEALWNDMKEGDKRQPKRKLQENEFDEPPKKPKPLKKVKRKYEETQSENTKRNKMSKCLKRKSENVVEIAPKRSFKNSST